jgi:hypothetical protein
MDVLPLIIRAEYRQGYRIRLTFNDGRQKTVDTNARAWLKRPPESLASAGGGARTRSTLGESRDSETGISLASTRRCHSNHRTHSRDRSRGGKPRSDT